MLRSRGGQKYESEDDYESEKFFKNEIDDIDDYDDDNTSQAEDSILVKQENNMSLKSDIHQFREICGAMVNHEMVQNGIITLIAINAAMMGIGTFPFVKGDPEINAAFTLVDKIFLSIFTAELGMQTIYLGFRLFLDGWLVFDFLIIVISWSFDTIGFIRAFRVFRALRLITRVKVMKNLVLALLNVLPRMGAIGLLLLLISYIFAVMLTQLFKDLSLDGFTDFDYFGRLDKTFFTLFQLMTLDGWSSIARQVIAVYKCKCMCHKNTIHSCTIYQQKYQSCFVESVGGWCWDGGREWINDTTLLLRMQAAAALTLGDKAPGGEALTPLTALGRPDGLNRALGGLNERQRGYLMLISPEYQLI